MSAQGSTILSCHSGAAPGTPAIVALQLCDTMAEFAVATPLRS